jgi:hypothetical protein
MARMGRILGWSPLRAALLRAGIHAAYLYERVHGWRRMVTLSMPERRNALGGSAEGEAEALAPAGA